MLPRALNDQSLAWQARLQNDSGELFLVKTFEKVLSRLHLMGKNVCARLNAFNHGNINLDYTFGPTGLTKWRRRNRSRKNFKRRFLDFPNGRKHLRVFWMHFAMTSSYLTLFLAQQGPQDGGDEMAMMCLLEQSSYAFNTKKEKRS